MLVYDITQEKTFDNISKWLRNIEEVMCLLTLGNTSRFPEIDKISKFKGAVS